MLCGFSPVDAPSTIHGATEISLDAKHQRATFTFPAGVLVVGNTYVLHIRFDGEAPYTYITLSTP